MELIRTCPHCGDVLLDPRKKVKEFIPPAGYVEVHFTKGNDDGFIRIFADNDMEWMYPVSEASSPREVLLKGLHEFLANVTEFYSSIALFCDDPMFEDPVHEPKRRERVEWDVWKAVKSRLARRLYISINYLPKSLLREKLKFLKSRFNKKLEDGYFKVLPIVDERRF